MSTPPETDFATRIMNAAIAYDTPTAPPTPAMLPAETIADLECQVQELKAENKAMKKRAAERYTQMLHATRHADRTQEAFKREKEDRLDSEIKAVKAYRVLEKRIADLEHENEQEQRSARNFAHLQELQSAKNRLQAELAQKKEALAAAQHTLKNLSSKTQEDKEKIKIEAKEAYDKVLAGRQKLWKEESAAATQKQSRKLESTRKENERLKEQLQKSQQALEWHKVQLQQQFVQRGGTQGSPMAAGIHAGFPLATQQSPSQVTDQRKRRRLNSSDNASLPTPEQRVGNANTVVSPTRRRAPAGGRQHTQSSSTPTRPPQGLNSNASLTQPLQQAQTQAQSHGLTEAFVQSCIKTSAQAQAELQEILMQATREGTLQQFREFAMSVNACNRQTGRSQSSTVALWHAFKARSAQEGNQQPPGSVSGQDGSQANASGNLAMMQNLPQGGGQLALQSPLQAPATPCTQQARQSFNNHTPLSNGALSPGAAGRMQTPQLYQQSPRSASQKYMQSPAMLRMSYNPMLTLTAGNDASSPAMSFTNASFGQATPQEVQARGDDLDHIAQNLARVRAKYMYPSPPEGLHGAQSVSASNDLAEIPGWASPTPNHENNFLEGAGDATFGNAHHSQPQRDGQTTPHQRQHSEAPSIISMGSSKLPPDNALARLTVSRKRPMAAPPSCTRSTNPATGAQEFPVCVHCHEKWWNETCDPGEPCQNCSLSGTSCERPKCYLETGECTNARCSRVHQGDTRFRYVVPRPKTLKRTGKRGEATDSPVVMMRKQHSKEM